MRIMYVEDNAVNLELVRRIARLGGHDVVSFTNGRDALEALQTDTAHLILMDIQLEGEMDGIEVVKRLRARGDQRPIIAVTAYAMRGDEDRILGAGCNDYLPKPLPISQFITLLAKYDPSNPQPLTKVEPTDETAMRRPTTAPLVLPKTPPVPPVAATPTTTTAPVAAPTPAPVIAPAAVLPPSAVVTPTTPVVPLPPPMQPSVPTTATPTNPTPAATPVASTPAPTTAPVAVATTPTPIPVPTAAGVQPTASPPPTPQLESSDDKSG